MSAPRPAGPLAGEVQREVAALVDDGLLAYSTDQLLAIAGQKHLRDHERLVPSSELIEELTLRGEESVARRARWAQLVGQTLLRRCHSALQALSVEDLPAEAKTLAAASLRSADGGAEQYSRQVSRIAQAILGPIRSVETAALLAAAVAKCGLAALTQVCGCSRLEAEQGYLQFELVLLEGQLLGRSPLGEATARWEADERAILAPVEPLQWESFAEPQLRHYGDTLWTALFPGPIAALFAQCQGYARAQDLGIRLRLIVEDPALLAVPWELARTPQVGGYLAAEPRILFSRYILCDGAPLAAADKPWQELLLVTSQPSDLDSLDIAKEEHSLAELWRSSGLQVIKPLAATARALDEALHGRAIDILHYIGHGGAWEDGAALYLESATGTSAPYSAAPLTHLLRQGHTVRLVYLSCCHGGTSDSAAEFLALAPALLRAGVRAVVAVQGAIRDRAASRFASEFYRYACRGFPLDFAVQRGRLTLLNELSATRQDFCLPILFTRHAGLP